MTNFATRLDAIGKDYWRCRESDADHAERFEKACESASWFFERATVAQKAAYDRAMADLRGLAAPKYDRLRDLARAVWFASTTDASDLYLETVSELMRDGECSEALSERWDALCARQQAAEAA